jgi:signal transduction histidine kinase
MDKNREQQPAMNSNLEQDDTAVASMSVEEALSDLWGEFTSAGGARFCILVEGRPKTVQPGIQEQISLIGREALVNALRHSEATSIEAEVQYLPRRLRVIVRDNGCGIDPKVVRAGRDRYWGLLGMHERAKRIGGEMDVWSELGAGTEVELCIPASIAYKTYAGRSFRLFRKWTGRAHEHRSHSDSHSHG